MTNENVILSGMDRGKVTSRYSRRFSREWLFYAVSMFVLGAMFVYMVHFRHAITSDSEKDRLANAASAAEVMISDQLDKIRITLDKIRASLGPDWQRSDSKALFISDRLNILSSAMTSVRALFILDTLGVVVASNQEQFVGQSFAHRDYFLAPAGSPMSDTLYVSPPFENAAGVWLIAVSKAMVDANGEFAGIVAVTLDPQDFKLTLNAVRNSPQTWAALIHGDGNIFVWEPTGQELDVMNLAQPGTLFTQHMQSGRDASFFTDMVRANGEKSMLALRTIQPERLRMNRPLVVGIGRNLEAFYRDSSGYAAYHFLVYVLIIVLGGAVLHMTQRVRRTASLETEKAEGQLRELREELASFFEISSNLLGIVDVGGVCRKLNPSWGREMGYGAADFSDMSFFEFFHPEDRGLVASSINELLQGGKPRSFIARFRNKDGQYRHLEWSLAVRHASLFVAASDVSERVAVEVQLQRMAYYDRLTGLPNRLLFFDRLKQVLAVARRGVKKAAVMFIDLDGFKEVNDVHGHDAGDKVLQAMAQRLTRVVRKADTVARLGGDEFVVLLHEVGSPDDAITVARKVLDGVGEDISIGLGNTVRIGASIGISLWPDNGTCVDDILVAADMAMYQSKKKGKNCFSVASERRPGHQGICFDDEFDVGVDIIDSQHLELAAIVSNLCNALRDGQAHAAIIKLFNELRSSTEQHFATEHELMVRHQYPERRIHDEKHGCLLRELRDMESQLSKEGALFLTDHLRHWLLEHIRDQDKALGHFLAGTGVTN